MEMNTCVNITCKDHQLDCVPDCSHDYYTPRGSANCGFGPKCTYCMGNSGDWCYTSEECGREGCTSICRREKCPTGEAGCVLNCNLKISHPVKSNDPRLPDEELSTLKTPQDANFECKLILTTVNAVSHLAFNWITTQSSTSNLGLSWTFYMKSRLDEKQPISRKFSNRFSKPCTYVFIFEQYFILNPSYEYNFLLEHYSWSTSTTIVVVTDFNPPAENPRIWVTMGTQIFVHIWDWVTLEYSKTTDRYHQISDVWGSLIQPKHRDFSRMKVGYPFQGNNMFSKTCSRMSTYSGKNIAAQQRFCQNEEIEYLFMEGYFNLTLTSWGNQQPGRDGDYLPKFVAEKRFVVKYSTDDVAALAVGRQTRPGIIYCKKYDIFGTENASIDVWLSPFDQLMWILLILMVLLIALNSFNLKITSVREVARAYAYQIYVLTSILIRNGVQEYTQRFCLFGLLSQLIPCLYESIITGKLLAPIAPHKFQDVGELVRNGYVINYDIESYDKDMIWKEEGIIEEFKKGGVSNKLNDSFIYTSLNLLANFYKTQRGKDTMVNMLSNEDRFQCYLSARKEPEVVLLSEEIELFVRLVKKRHKCHVLRVGDRLHFYWFFYVPHKEVVIRLHTLLYESGILNMWEEIWYNFIKIVQAIGVQKIGVEDHFSDVIRLENLSTFFMFWGFAILFASMIFIVELSRGFFKVLIHCWKVGRLLVWIFKSEHFKRMLLE